MKDAYHVDQPDFALSPFTGMTRQHYVDCAKYILERAFRNHVKSFEDPIVFPVIPGSGTPSTPSSGTTNWWVVAVAT